MIDLGIEFDGNALEELRQEKLDLLAELSPKSEGLAWCASHTTIVDRAIQTIYRAVRQAREASPRVSIVATGGYGRREMAPFSDIDLTIVPAFDQDPELDGFLRTFYRALHQVLGGQLKYEIGYSFRLVADVAGLDSTTRTGLLDSRLVAGSESVFAHLMDIFWSNLPAGEFALAKISERAAAEAKFHNTPLVVQPHLKEGCGALRSYQSANWLRSAIGERPMRPSAYYDRLLAARNLLHSVVGKKQDLLSTARQSEIFEKYDLDPNQFMKSVHESLIEGADQYRNTLERVKEARFELSEGVFAVKGEVRVAGAVDAGKAAAGIAIGAKLNLDVSDLGAIFCPTVDGPAAAWACSTDENVLRQLDRAGVLAELLPELTNCRTLMPGDPWHVYTVFEHTLKVIGRLDEADQDPFLGELKGVIGDTSILYLAGLLHDVGKLPSMTSGKSHSEEGAEMAEQVCSRWNLSQGVGQQVAWLVKEHLTMSLFMRLRDIDLPETIHEFASIVESEERLAMLTLLTWADISSGGDESLTSAQDSFLRSLASRTRDYLARLTDEPQFGQPRAKLIRRGQQTGIAEDEIDSFLDELPAYYIASTGPETIKEHIASLKRVRSGGPIIELKQRPDMGLSEIHIYAPDFQGLLTQALGSIYAFDISLMGLRAFTTSGNGGATPRIAIDSFTVSFGGRMVPSGTWRHLQTALEETIGQRVSAEDWVRRKGKDPDRIQKVLEYKYLPGDPSILEVQSPRGRGMPYRISRVLTNLGLDILSARVGQWGGRATAAFYVDTLEKTGDVAELLRNGLGNHESA